MLDVTTRSEGSPSAYLLAYGAALLSVGLAVVIYPLLGLPGNVNFVLFLTAVAFSAWYGGLGPGLLATVLSVLVASYFFLPPNFTLEIDDPVARGRLIIFVLAALFINGLSYARARADARTASERARLEVTLASIGDAVIVTDTQGRITFMNPVAETLTGWKQSEAAGKDLAGVFNVVDEQTQKPVDNLVARVVDNNTLAQPKESSYSLLVSRDGTSRPIENNGAPIRSSKGDISGVVLVFRDISDRRERDSEQEKLLGQVEQERKRLEDIIASVPGVVWEAWGGPDETDQNINFVSDYVETMLGYTVEEWVNTPNFWLTIVHPDDKEVAAAAANETFQSGRTKPNRFRWITKDGRIIWVESYSTPIVDRNGMRLGMRGVTMNVNEQKQLEDWVRRNAEQLQLEYERLASLIDHINIGLVLVDKAGRYVLANNKWLEQTGYEREEVIGKSHNDFSTNPRGDTTEAMLQKVLSTGEALTLREYFLQNSHRLEGWYADWSMLPMRDADGNITGVLNALFDVTEKVKARQEIEEQRATLRTIVEGTPIGLALVDREMRIVDLNAEWARMTGIDLSSAKGRVLYDINPGFEERRAYYDRVIAGESIDLQNIPYGPPEKGPHYRDIILRPVRDPGGVITGMLNAVVDVTSRHLLDKQKDEFIAVASHELKTPITTIKGYTQLSLRSARKLGEESLVRALTAVDERANRLTRLVNEMLDVSRLESGSLPLETEPFDVIALVREIVKGTELVNPEFRFEFELPDQPLTVEGDRQRIEQVVTNLVQNAMKYSGNNSTATVGVMREGDRAIVCVRDYGLGIPSSQQADVFKRFFRGSNVGYTNYGGLGLGLYISNSIVERHGGHMWLESEEGKGSTFYFDLPLSEANQEA